jgi:hypothetical protein
MIEFTHATTRYKVRPENAANIRAALEKPKKHKPVALSNTNLKRIYPVFYAGMTTADYVDTFNAQFDKFQHDIKHTCANYDKPAPMLDASVPECVEDENPDYVYIHKKIKKTLAQQLAEADNTIDALDDKVKHLRAALMALEAEVSPGMRAFIREVLE